MLRRFFPSLALAAVAALPLTPVRGNPVPPDSMGGNPANPGVRIQVTGPRFTPITVRFTNCGGVITNADGSVPQFGGRLVPEFNASVPGMLNGLPVTDLIIIAGLAGAPADPGYLQASAFSDGIMTTTSVGSWLCANGYVNGAVQITPNFLCVEYPDIYYAVDLAELGDSGAAFVTAFSPGSAFTVDEAGKIPDLPAYTFSLTPFAYAPGIGWVPTSPAPTGITVTFEGYNEMGGECGPPCPGDVNGDGVVDLADLATQLSHFGMASGATLSDGDLDGDGDVELSDLAQLLANFGAICA